MATIHVGSDNINTRSDDSTRLAQFCEKLKAAGHTVVNAGVGDNAIQGHMLSSSNKCDVMVQIAGGQCPGTFADFNWGTRPGGYYHADKFCMPIDTHIWTNYAKFNPKSYKLPLSAWDDNFSGGLDKSQIVGKTWQQVSNEFERCLGFVEGKTVDELANGFLKLLGGGKDSSGGQGGGGGSILELIKQAASGWRPYGPELILEGDTLSVRRTNPKTAKPMTSAHILSNSVSVTDYDSNTPNVNGTAKDEYLINRFGQIPITEPVNDPDVAQILQVAQRGHNHSIDLKCLINPDFRMGKWVTLTLDDLGYKKRNYYITKSAYQEERIFDVTLEPAPPDIYVELPEVTTEEEDTTDAEIDTEEEE